MHSPSPNRAVAVAYAVTSPLRLNAGSLCWDACSYAWAGWAATVQPVR